MLTFCSTLHLLPPLLMIGLLIVSFKYHPVETFSSNCGNHRRIYDAQFGRIDSYENGTFNCEWLISTGWQADDFKNGSFINLQIITNGANCSTDTLYIFDGASYEDTLIATVKLDGQQNNLPTLIASSGRMLLLQYSEKDIIPSNFTAYYSIFQCPLNCSNNHGTCNDHRCSCESFWTGDACQFASCPANCSFSGKCVISSSHHSTCSEELPSYGCQCMFDYMGESCDVPKNEGFASQKHRQNKWKLLFSNENVFHGRASHDSTYDPVTDSIFTFGGRGAYESTLGDLLVYSIFSNKWNNLTSCKASENQPKPLWGHSLTTFNSTLLLFGGIFANGSLSNELWSYQISLKKWTLKEATSISPLAFHSATLVDSEWLYIFGGRQKDGYHSSKLFRISLSKEPSTWQLVQVLNDKPFARRLIGHSAVFYKHLRSIVIFGGALWMGRQKTRLSNDLHMFNVDNRVWSRLKYSHPQDSLIPSPRAFHSMLLVEHYLLLFGGHTDDCSTTRLYVYSLICHKWWSDFDYFMSTLSLTFSSSEFATSTLSSHSSVFSQAHNLVFVLGGFSSHVRHEVYVYSLPKVLFNASQFEHCSRLKSKMTCNLVSYCFWCPSFTDTSQNRSTTTGYCAHYELKCSHSQVAQLNYCPGLCPRLSNCYSCLANTIENMEIFEKVNLGGFPVLHQSHTCQWNSLDLQCRANFSQSVHFSHSLVNYNDCLTHNIESGITFLKYFYPQNISHPDQTLVLPHINVKSSYNDGISRSVHHNESLVHVGRILGHIHPFGLKPYQENKLRLYLGSTSPFSTFFFNGHTINSSNILTDFSKSFHRSFFDLPINFSSDSLLEDNFLIDLIVKFPIRTTSEVLEYEKIEINLAESANSVLSNLNLTPFRDEHQCHQLSTCTSCVSNMACAWSLTNQCTTRSNVSQSVPENSSVIIDSEQCITCTDYTECESCLSSSDWCEWLPQQWRCLRRGRSPSSLHHLSLCSQPCSSRVSCELCLDDTGQCLWCQSRQQCISAAAYHSSPSFDYCHSFDLQLNTHGHSFFSNNQHLIAKFDLNHSQILCDKCLRHSTCLLCESVPLCGWCILHSDSSQGFCATRNHLNENECNFSSKLIYSTSVISVKDGKEENFIPIDSRTCPLVNECRHMHNCHPDADCIDTEQSFRCACRPGFSGDGHNCVRTCIQDCGLHGYCSHFPDYKCICDLGWHGVDCNEDCGCNYHSTCHSGKCDHCEDNTTGEQCQLCKVGSFGSATNSSIGCKPCQCNQHGDESRGHCDTETGHCWCLHKTEGAHCERCQLGFYGDARQGGHCFMECQDRAMISQVDHGYFGSYIRDVHFKRHSSLSDLPPGTHITCLWVFTTHKSPAKNDTFASYYSSLDHSLSSPIQITVFSKGQLNCSSSKVTLYDGIPQFISASAKVKFTPLATLCGREVQVEDVTVMSMSGFVTVYYTSDSFAQGFNASYTKLSQTKMETKENVIPQTNQSILFSSIEIHRTTLVHLDSLTDDKNWPNGQHFLYSWDAFLLAIGGDEDATYLNMAAFDKSSKSWLSNEQMNTGNERPSNRHFYAITKFKDMFFVSGGLSTENNQQVFRDFWSCTAIEHNTGDIVYFKWSKVEALNQEIIPPTLGHSLTLIDMPIDKLTAILLIGGYSPSEGFLQHQFLYWPLQNLWKKFNTQGALPVGVFGHSAVYYKQLNAVYLFGGVVHVETQKSVISDTLYVLNMTTRVWHRIRPSDSARSGPWPKQRYLHTAAVISNFMVISGGQDRGSVHVEGSFWVYHFDCDNWKMLNMSQFDANEAAGLIYQPRIQSLAYEPSENILYLYETAMISNVTKNQIRRRISTIQIPDKFTNLTKCNTAKQSLACSMYDNCIDCTARNHIFGRTFCQWCTNCRDKQGHCIALNDTCDWIHSNTSRIDVCHYSSVEDSSQCPLHRCLLATDCQKCLQISQAKSGEKSSCIWTRQVYKFIKFGHNPEMSPVEDWTCIDSAVINETLLTNVETVPPTACPARCHMHSTCSLCLEAASGDESGSHECLYDTLSRECISPMYSLMRCSDGHACGTLLTRNSYAQCPLDCESYRKASDCVSASHCGWCAISGLFELDGIGVCLRGGLFDSFNEPCNAENTNLLTFLAKKANNNFTVQWHYLYLPKENECANGHHTCNSLSQKCVDLEDGFMCRCKPEYILVENICRPICIQGCVHGHCIVPNICECDFGYVGSDCSLKCKCHGHGNCRSSNLDHCLECNDNTMGQFCEKCQPFYVGDPKNKRACISCQDYCHNHSSRCFSEEMLNGSLAAETNNTTFGFWDDLSKKVTEGIESRAICVDCQNNTEGDRCDRCRLGFFKISDDIRDGCRQCVCGQHGWLCNPFNGENCNCQNNTENDRQCNYLNSKEYSSYINKTYFIKSAQVMTTYSLPCWMLQCSKCKDYFYGMPTNGHQCFRHMNFDKEYCLDSEQDTDCLRNPRPLFSGRTVFFAIQPRFMNVDIKIILTVIRGEVDLYITTKDDLFVVQTNQSNGFHHTYIDKNYLVHQKPLSANHKTEFLIDDNLFLNENAVRKPFYLREDYIASSVPEYHTVQSLNEISMFRKVRYRLEVTIPYKTQDLRVARYFLVVRGRSHPFMGDQNLGYILFRQDQCRIDLFIFFSVFFSAFFFFISFFFSFFKLKQIYLNRRAHQLHQIELVNMASRPFARIFLSIDDRTEVGFRKCSTCGKNTSVLSTPSKKMSLFKHLTQGFRESPKIYPESGPITTKAKDKNANTGKPVAIEPTSDGLAAIMTTIVQLPGGVHVPNRIAAASTLISLQHSPHIGQQFS